MSFANPNTPNLPDFIVFCQAQGVNLSDLDPASPYYVWAFDQAKNIALYIPQVVSIVYVLSVYNLGMHTLLKIAQDSPPSTFFADQRKAFFLMSVPSGAITSSADQGTSQSNVVSEWQKTLTLSGMDLMRTPWGVSYLQYAQSYGPNVVGVS